MIDDGRDLLPENADLDAIEREAVALGPMPYPRALPRLAFAFYTRGGCYALALALAEAGGGLPIEVWYDTAGEPSHAYAVSGTEALDARGGIPLRHARAGATRLVVVNSPDELAALVLQVMQTGPALVARTGNPKVVAAATRAAQRVFAAHPDWNPNAP